MPQVALEPTIPVLQREKTVHALDRAATVKGFPEASRTLAPQGLKCHSIFVYIQLYYIIHKCSNTLLSYLQ
jgi:hypothetical protein